MEREKVRKWYGNFNLRLAKRYFLGGAGIDLHALPVYSKETFTGLIKVKISAFY